jgi:uncharacterized protein (DUF58 family)
MVREFEDPPEDDLTLIVVANRRGGELLEYLISFAATICWEWCRQRGDRFVLLLAGEEIQLVSGITGPALAEQMLQCLALEEGTERIDSAELMRQLHGCSLPSGPILVLSPADSTLAEQVRQALSRSVVALTACSEQEGGLFQL